MTKELSLIGWLIAINQAYTFEPCFVDLYIGGNSAKIQGEPLNLLGKRCFSAYFDPTRDGLDQLSPHGLKTLYDSGAFQDICGDARITPEEALSRQILRERQLAQSWCCQWSSYAIASYDRLIGEKWVNGLSAKGRWNEADTWSAVSETIDAAKYLVSQRKYLGDRHLILGCQGVTAKQYRHCVERVLPYAIEHDWIGLGGWCLLGKNQRWFPLFCETLLNIIPLIAQTPVKHVHLYGVLWLPALGVFQAMCDEHELTCSTDSKKPLSDCRWKTPAQRKQAGARADYWLDNCNWWHNTLQNLSLTPDYKLPHSQLNLFDLSVPGINLFTTQMNKQSASNPLCV